MDNGESVPQSETQRRFSRINALPLLRALERIRDAGRERKDSGVDDAAVEYARLASSALAWLEADERGDLMEAEVHLEQVYQRKLP